MRVSLQHRRRRDTRRDQQAAARIDAEGAQFDAVAVGVLDQRRLAGVLIDGEDRDVVFAADHRRFAFETRTVRCAVGQIDEFAVGMHMDRAGGLPHRRLRVRQRVFDEHRLAPKPRAGAELVNIELVLPLDRDEHPRLGRMKVEVARAEAQAVAGRDRSEIAQHAVAEGERLDCAGIFRLVRLRVVAARHQRHRAVPTALART